MKKKRNLSEISKLSGGSLDIKAGQVEKLKSLFPQTVKDGEIDFDALKLALGSETDTNGQSYGLSWAGKADCFRHIQQTTTATLKPDRKESVDFDNTENIFIEGDNLEVLKVLQKNYYGKVKMIYIDPPYNTGNDSFIYPDRFKEEKADYEERAGIKDAEGLLTKDGFFRKNSKDTGHFHSNWLCMMYPRLFLAKNLLREDGVIFVSIDDNEVHNLRMIMNEIFGEENFVGQFTLQSNPRGSQASTHLANVHEYVLMYAKYAFSFQIKGFEKDEEAIAGYSLSDHNGNKYRLIGLRQRGGAWKREHRRKMFYPIYVDPKTGKVSLEKNKQYPIQCLPKRPTGEEGRWTWSKSKCEENIELLTGKKVNRVGEDDFWDIFRIDYLVDENGIEKATKPKTIWTDKEINYQNGRSEIKLLFKGQDIFDFPKPTFLIQKIVQMLGFNENDIVFDFFAGSCTTAHAIYEYNLNNKGKANFLCVQLAEPCDKESEAYKAGFKTIADIGKERIQRAGKKIKAENAGKLDFDGGKLDLGFKVFRLDESNFKQWRADIKTGEELKEQMKMFVDNKKKGSAPEDMLYEIILKNSRFDLNVKLEKKTFGGIGYYNLTDGEEIICLADKITKKLAEKILKEKPQKFTCLDTAFKNNDQLKTNTALQMKAQEPEIEFMVT